MRPIFASWLLVWLAACTTPFHPPVFVTGSTEFAGIVGLMGANTPVDVVLVHGMCTHDDGDADRAMEEIVGAIDRNVRPPATSMQAQAQTAATRIRIYEREIAAAGSVVRFHALMWSGMTTPLKSQLAYDKTGEPTDCSAVPSAECKPRRAKYNGQFKDGLLDDCLADAIIYQGASHAAIKAEMVAAITRLANLIGEGDGPLVLVSASLGSKMTFDALADMLDAAEGSEAKAAARRLSKRLALLYMEANQLPILGLADQDVGTLVSSTSVPASAADGSPALRVPGSLQRFLSRRAREPQIWRADDLKIVAFSDPNDLLSFRLIGSRYSAYERVTIADVLVSNSSTYLGLFENPMKAHLGYGLNPDVAFLIACGRPKSGNCR